MTRIGISARAFGLAAALGLAASGKNLLPNVAGSFLLLCAIAAVASVPQHTETAQKVVPIVEGALVGLTLAIDGPTEQPLILYLVIPALIAGLVGGPIVVLITILVELATMAAIPIVQLEAYLLPTTLRLTLPWLLTALGVGLLGSWIRRLRTTPTDADREGYLAAHRLLNELRVVSRRLSAGLDPVTLAKTLLDDCVALVTEGRGAVLIRTDGGTFASLAQDLDGLAEDVINDPVVLKCWRTGEAEVTSRGQVRAGRHAIVSSPEPSRWALPLRVGTRMVGVLALDVGHHLDSGLLGELRALLDERSLQLDTALLFDEVRALATVEERHRLAREIHDGVAQEIAFLGYLVDDLAVVPDAVRAARVAHLRSELTRIVDDLRLSIFDLRSQVSRTSSLGAVLGDYLQEVGSRSDTAVHLTLDETPDRLRLEVEEQLLRIVQEAVTNARKHSGAANLWVTCRVRSPAAHLIVEDDGSGVHRTEASAGYGMSIMRERAERIGATLEVTGRVGGGTRMSVQLNARPEARAASPGEQPKPPELILAHPTKEVAADG